MSDATTSHSLKRMKIKNGAALASVLQTNARRYSSVWLPAAILMVALGLRLWGVNFGLPNLYHPDEDAVLMPALTIIKTGNLEPTRMEYGTLHIYVLTAVSALVFLISARNGRITDPGQIPIFERGTYPAVYAHPEYFLAARVVSALMGTGIVLLVYMLVRRLGNQRQGLLAAGLAAVLPALVTHAHFATPDTPLTFYSLLALYLLIRVYDNWESNTLWAYAGAGFACGLAASTKYNGIVLAVPLLLIPLFKARRLDDLFSFRTLVGPAGMALGFVVGTPYAVLKLPKFLSWSGYSLRLYNMPGYDPVGTTWQWHLNYHATSPNALVFFLGLVGMGLSFRYWGRRGLLVNSFAILLWLAILGQTRHEARMWLPTAPLFVAWTALMLDMVWTQLQRRWSANWVVVSAAIPLLILLPLLVSSVRIDRRLRAEDVRTQVQHWIEANVPPGTKIAVDYFAPNLNPDVWSVVGAFPVHQKSIDWYQEQDVQYLILNEANDNLSEDDLASWAALTNSTCLVKAFSGPFLSAESFHMWVYRVPPC